MYKIEISNEVNGRRFEGRFETKEEADAWIAKQVEKDSWGKKQRWVNDEDMTPELQDRILQTISKPSKIEGEAPLVQHEIKCDYVITETDLSIDKDFRNSQKKEARKEEYPTLEQVLHIILDHGLDSPEFTQLQAERQAIKAKYPLEE